MKKKKFVLLACLAFLLASCLFDSDDEAFASWISDQGIPESYKVQTLNIPNLVPKKAEAYSDTTPRLAMSTTVFGQSSKISHEMHLEFGFVNDSSFLKKLKDADTSEAWITFPLQTDFYGDDDVKVKTLPIKETLKVQVSWKLEKGNGKKFVEKAVDVSDSAWLESLKNWEPDVVFDTTYSVNAKNDSAAIYFDLPKMFIDSMIACNSGCHLQIRFAAPESENLYRFYMVTDKKSTALHMRADTLLNKNAPTPYRVADIAVNNDCSDCLVLHGGGFDSLVVEFPSKPILEALSKFYGDEFPYSEGDGYDVRQAVVLAQLTFARDDNDGENNLGLPIQVLVGSYLDSSGSSYYKRELYKLNKKLIETSGHPSMIFYDGDSLTLQVTEGARYFVNQAKNGANLKIMMRLGFPILQDKNPIYKDTVYIDTVYVDCDTCGNLKTAKDGRKYKLEYDTSYVRLFHFDYARYDFSNMMKKPVTLKLWLATKRGEVMNKREDD